MTSNKSIADKLQEVIDLIGDGDNPQIQVGVQVLCHVMKASLYIDDEELMDWLVHFSSALMDERKAQFDSISLMRN